MGMAVIAGAQLVLGAVGAFMQYSQASAAASLQAEAAQQEYDNAVKTSTENYRNTSLELDRQQKEVARISRDAQSDEERRARAEMAAMNVAFGEIGGMAGSNSALAIINNENYLLGTNLGRIKDNSAEKIESIQASKRSGAQDVTNATNAAGLQMAVSKASASLQKAQAGTSAFLSFVNSGLSIASQGYKWQTQQQIARGVGSYQPTQSSYIKITA